MTSRTGTGYPTRSKASRPVAPWRRHRRTVRVCKSVLTALAVSVGLSAVRLAPPFPAPPAGAATLAFTDINPDESGAILPQGDILDCPAPCPGGGSGGRVNGLASVPGDTNTFFAASEVGGLFKTTNRGERWFHLDGHVPTRSWDVAVAPGGQRVYATSFYDGRATGRSQSGVQTSEDGGQTWSRAPVVPPAGCPVARADQPSAYGISLRPGSASEVLVGTNCGIQRSVDSGASWAAASGDAAGRVVWDVVALAGGRTYACGEEGLLFSPDGMTWAVAGAHPAPEKMYCVLAVSPEDSATVFVVFAKPSFDPYLTARQAEFFEGLVTFDAVGGAQVAWSPIPFGDAPTKPPGYIADAKRNPIVATNDRSSGFDLWVGAGNLYRVQCNSAATPRCSTATPGWIGSFTDAENPPDPNKAHGDAGDLEFDLSQAVDACPTLFSSDGGVYRSRNTTSADCHTDERQFLPVNTGLHAQLLHGMAGVDRPGEAAEGIYLGLFDVGLFGTVNAGSATPTWTHGIGGDINDVVADTGRVVTQEFVVRTWNALDLTNMNVVPMPSGTKWNFCNGHGIPEAVDQVAPGQYVIAMNPIVPQCNFPPGVRFTADIDKNLFGSPVGSWPSSAPGPCHVQASAGPTGLQLYALAGSCNLKSPDQLWRFVPTGAWTNSPAPGTWTQVPVPTASQGAGFSMFWVDPRNADRLYASVVGDGGTRMVRWDPASAGWDEDQDLTDLMHGGGEFVSRIRDSADGVNAPEVQPTLVAFDPEEPDIVVAGGRESGVFLSSDGGDSWALLTDPSTPGTSNVPHLPRPLFAHFDHEPPGATSVYVGTAGRGVWRITLPDADLSLVKTDSPDPVPNGEALTYTLTATNKGPDAVRQVRITDELPGDVALVSVGMVGQGSCRVNARLIICTVPSLAPGASAAVAVKVVPGTPGPITNLARVSAAAVDRSTADNTASETTTVIPRSDLRVDKADAPDPALVGETVTYSLSVRNNGPDAATGVTLSDALPLGVAFVSATPSQGSCSHAAGKVTCSLGVLANGSTAAVSVRVVPTAKQTLVNVAAVASEGFDPNLANNSATARTSVVALIGGAFGESVDMTTLLGAQVRSGPAPSVVLPPGGAAPSRASLASAGIGGLVRADLLDVVTAGGRSGADVVVASAAEVAKASMLGGTVVAEGVHSECRAGLAGAAGATRIARLVINGAPVRVTSSTQVSIPGVGVLSVDEQVPAGPTSVIANALHLRLDSAAFGKGDIIIAQSRCGIDQ